MSRVRLADGADRWYQGSGATERAGNYFGYQGRNAQGATSLGTVLEANVRWRADAPLDAAGLCRDVSPAATWCRASSPAIDS